MVYHRQLPIVCHKAEFRFFFVVKIISYIVYIIIISDAAAQQKSLAIIAANVVFIAVGVLTMIYSYCIFNIKSMSQILNGHPQYGRLD